MWDVLGLEPTTDQGAVRRAYAARLKRIDVDRDPAAFIRLREAYENCLRWEGPPHNDDEDDDWLDPPIDAPVQPAPTTASRAGDPSDAEIANAQDDRLPSLSSMQAFDAAYAQAKADGRFPPLAALYQQGLVQAFIPVGEEPYAHAAVVRIGAADLDTPFAEIRRFADAHAWNSSIARSAPDFGAVYAARLAAETWYENQIKLSRESIAWLRLRTWVVDWPWFAPSPARAARVLVGKVAPWRLREDDARVLQQALVALQRHAPYLGARVNPERLAKLQRRVDFLTRKSGLLGFWRWLRWVFGLFIKLALGLILMIFAIGLLLVINSR